MLPFHVQRPVPQTSVKTFTGQNGTRLFFSYSTSYFPPESGTAWYARPGEVNEELLKSNKDETALTNALWDTATLTAAAQLTNKRAARERAAAIMQSMFTGNNALPPSLKYARVQPTRSKSVFRTTREGFQALDDIGLILLDEETLPLGPKDRAALVSFVQCVSSHFQLLFRLCVIERLYGKSVLHSGPTRRAPHCQLRTEPRKSCAGSC
jgi:hypothetical protein